MLENTLFRRSVAITTSFAILWLSLAPVIALAKPPPKGKGIKRSLTPLEMSRIHGAGKAVAMIATVDRSVDGQTGSTYPWEGNASGLNTANGNKLTVLPVVSWGGRDGTGVSLALYHNSVANGDSQVGQHWTHSYEIYGVVDPNTNDFSVRWGDGLGYKFTRNINGSFSVPSGVDDRLVADSTGWTLTTRNQVRYRFEGGTGNRKNGVWIKDRSNNQVTIAHNIDDTVASVTDPTGRTLAFNYSSGKLSGVSGPASRTFTFTRDSNGDLIGVGFPMNTSISYGYDSLHRIISVTDAGGKVWTKGYTSVGNALAWEKDPLNRQVTYSYGSGYTTITDPLGRVTRHNYGTGGQLVSVTDPGNHTTNFGYTSYRKTSTTSPLGIANSLTYDSSGNVLTSTDGMGNVTTFTYNANNDVVSVTSPMGKVVTNTYDSAGRITSTTDAFGHTTSYTLNNYGLVTSVTNSLGKTATVSFDTNGNAVSATDPSGHTSSTTYNILGMPLTATDATSRTITTTYDSLGRVISVTRPGNRTTSFTYDANNNKLTETNALGHVNCYVYNDAGQLVSQTDPLGRTVSFGYNVAGQKVSFTDGLGHVTTYNYNSAGVLSGITHPDGTSVSCTFNANNQIVTTTDGRGVVSTTSYNANGEATTIAYSDGTPGVSFSYDNDGAKTSMTDGTGTTTYSYDTGGRLTQRDSPQGSVTFGYNSANQLIARTLAGSGLTTFGYDDLGRLTSATSPSGENTIYTYDDAGRRVGAVLGNGSTETDSYNAEGDLVGIWHKTATGTTIARQQYTTDALGRRVSETLDGGVSAVAYGFDDAGQLTSEVRTGNNAYSASYTYDAAGNRISKTLGGVSENYSYDAANKLLSAGGKTYTYDAAGNTTSVTSSSGTVNLAWDGGGRLKSATTSAGIYTYTSNGLGQRVAKSGPGVSKNYILGNDNIDASVLSDGAASYVYAGGLVSEHRAGSNKFYHADALGTTRAMSDASGTVTDSLTTDAFGLTVTGSGSTQTPFGFAGQAGYQSDPETGLMRLGHRYYDSSTGRFISRDPILAGYNWYTYCGNDPVNKLDPTGLLSKRVGAILIGVVIGVAVGIATANPVAGIIVGGGATAVLVAGDAIDNGQSTSVAVVDGAMAGAEAAGAIAIVTPVAAEIAAIEIGATEAGAAEVGAAEEGATLGIGHGTFHPRDGWVETKRPIHFYVEHDTRLDNDLGNAITEQIVAGSHPTPVETIPAGGMVRRYKLTPFTPEQAEDVIFPPGSVTPKPGESIYIDELPGDGPCYWLACREVL